MTSFANTAFVFATQQGSHPSIDEHGWGTGAGHRPSTLVQRDRDRSIGAALTPCLLSNTLAQTALVEVALPCKAAPEFPELLTRPQRDQRVRVGVSKAERFP